MLKNLRNRVLLKYIKELFIYSKVLTSLIFLTSSLSSNAIEISYHSFTDLAVIGPPVEDFSANLEQVSSLALGRAEVVKFVKLPSNISVPATFGNIVEAVEAGATSGGFDAAYVPAISVNSVWGFIYTSGIPFGPGFDEFLGFLYADEGVEGTSGLDLLNSIIERKGVNVVVVPVAGGSEQGSEYFREPIGNMVETECSTHHKNELLA